MRRTVALAALLVAALAAAACAVETKLWELTTADEFRTGELDGTVLSSDGIVFLGSAVKTLACEDKGLWSLAVGPDGTAWAGSAESGKVFRLREGVLAEAASTGELTVTDLLPESDGVYVATIPNGRIFKIAPDGACALFAELPAKQVWALARAGDEILAATGPDGQLFALDAGGKHRTVWQAKAGHLLSLAVGNDGTAYFGADRPGVLFSRAPDGRVRALHDFGDLEVRSIALTPAGIVVAANRVTTPPAPGDGMGGGAALAGLLQRMAGEGKQIPGEDGGGGIVIEDGATLEGGAGLAGGSGEGFVYRLDPRGRREELLHLAEGPVAQVRALADGGVAVAGGTGGSVHRVGPDGATFTVLRAPGRQVQAIATRQGTFSHAALAGVAGLAVVEGGRPANAAYRSRVFDAGFPAEWGNVAWSGDGHLAFSSRSGNTALPDETWSDWSPSASASPVKVASPPGRFLQFRFSWDADPGATLRVVRLAWLVTNQGPVVRSVQVGPSESPADAGDGVASGAAQAIAKAMGASTANLAQAMADASNAASGPSNGGQPKLAAQAGRVKSVSWTAEDPDGDTLVHRVWCAREGSEDWILLTAREPIAETEYAWDTESFPDGYYVLRVEASDENANSRGDALRHARVSPPVLVDNTRPRVLDLAVSPEGTCSGTAIDGYSLVQRIEISLDGGAWVRVAPVGRLNDASELAFAVPLGVADERSHVIAVRAVDLGGNVGSAQVSFRLKR